MQSEPMGRRRWGGMLDEERTSLANCNARYQLGRIQWDARGFKLFLLINIW